MRSPVDRVPKLEFVGLRQLNLPELIMSSPSAVHSISAQTPPGMVPPRGM